MYTAREVACLKIITDRMDDKQYNHALFVGIAVMVATRDFSLTLEEMVGLYTIPKKAKRPRKAKLSK